MANQDWKVTPQANGQLQWGFPSGTPPTGPAIATIPNPPQQSQAFSVDWAQYVTGAFTSASLNLISGSITGWALGGADHLTLTFTAGGGAQSGVVQLSLVWSGGTVVSNNVTLTSTAALAADTVAPTIPLELAATLNAQLKPVLTWSPSTDPAPPGQQSSGMSSYPITKGGSALVTVAAPDKGFSFAATAIDIGAPTIAGSTVQTGPAFAMTGGGADYYNSADQGQFAYVQVTGNFTMTAKLTAASWSQEFSKVGFDARLNLSAGSPHVAAFACRDTDGGVQMNVRSTQGGSTTTVSLGAAAYSLPIYLRLTRVGNVFTMTTSPTGAAGTFTQIGTTTTVLASQLYVGLVCAALQNGSTSNCTLDQVNLSQDAQLTYTDTNVTQGTNSQTLSYAVYAKDNAANFSVASTAATVVIPGTSPAGSLLAYLKALPATTKLSGQTLDWWTPTPLDVFNAATPTWAGVLASGVLPEPARNAPTHLLPAIIDIICAQRGSISGMTNIGGGGANIDSTNAAPNDWYSLVQTAQANGFLVKIDYQPNNPAGNGNPCWGGTNDVNTPGTAAYNTLVGWVNNLALKLKGLKPFFFCYNIETNLGPPNAGLTNANWAGINAQSTGVPTSAQVAANSELVFKTLVAAGCTNFLNVHEPNFGVGNQGFGYPGGAYIDILAFDNGPLTYNDTGGYATLAALGSQPMFCGSLVTNYGQNLGQNQFNTATSYQNYASYYPRAFGFVTWAQTAAMDQQLGAAAAMSAPYLDYTKLPVFSSAGGVASTAGPSVPAPAAAVGFNTQTFNSTTLGTMTGQLQSFNFYGNTVPAGGITQSGNNLVLSGNSGNSYGATVATAAYNASKAQLFQGIAFGGGYYIQVVASYAGTQSGDAMAIWANDVEHMSGFMPQTSGQSWIENDSFEWNVSGSSTQVGFSLHNWYNQGATNQIVDPPSILAASPLTIPSGTLNGPNTYGVLIVAATPTTQGYIQEYINNVPVGTPRVTNAQGILCNAFWNKYSSGQAFPPAGANIGNIIDTLHMVPIIGTSSTSTPMTISSVQVWQASTANNLTF